jgi:N-acetylglucosaminyl-diphospho-decaprenol L-rhamnosyltransferase
MPHLAVVIVSWNVRELLRACLRSLFADLATSGLQADVWVVDNGSTDGTPAMIAGEFPAVQLVASDKNLGFAAGNNVALRAILQNTRHATRSTPYVWLLNPDTEVQPGATVALLSALESDRRASMVGAKLLYPDGSLQQSAFRFPGLIQLTFEFFPLPPRFYDTPLNGRYPRRLYEGETSFLVDHPLGATMMVRAEAIADVGLLDEGFWMYCEEIDWCWRMRKAGWRAYCTPAAQVVHHAGESSGQVRVTSFAALWRSRLRLYDKHYPPLKCRAAHRLVRLGMHWKMQQARVAYRRGRISTSELTARLDACQTVLTL